MSRLLTVKLAAQALTCSQSFVYEQIKNGRLVAIRLGKGQGGVRIAEEDLEAFLAEARIPKDEPIKLRHITI